ncbi:MAG: xylulokinase [Planctomycetes bacterium]|nr:xylulokinase [Planctomycetota bacterium]
MALYLGIDVGTSGTRTLVCTRDGKILASATAPHTSHHPHPGWSEQEPEEWWQATLQSVRAALAQVERSRDARVQGQVAGIGLSGQMHGSVFLDKADRVIRPAILWNDQRTAAECAEIEERAGGGKALLQMVANPALTGFTAPKILWLRNNEPRLFDRTTKVLLPKDYVRFRMTGQFATEVSDASGTLLLDVANRAWCKRLLEKLDLDRALLPPCFESDEVSGKVSAQVAAELGVPRGTPVVGGGGDQAAGAVGNGIVKPGVISATMGTSGVVFAFADKVQIDPDGRVHTFCHAVRGKWHIMGVVLSAGGSFQWFRNQLGQSEIREAKQRNVDPYELLTAQAAQAPPGCEGLFFLPYLTGERTPHADPDAKGAWIGLSVRHGRPHLIRSVMEGATFAMRDSLAIIRGMKVPIKQIRLSGGGARSPFWRQLQADIYGHKVVTINAEEGPAYGVALLAMVGTGAYDSIAEACDATIRVVSETVPDRRTVLLYHRSYPVFDSLYQSLRASFKDIAKLVSN